MGLAQSSILDIIPPRSAIIAEACREMSAWDGMNVADKTHHRGIPLKGRDEIVLGLDFHAEAI